MSAFLVKNSSQLLDIDSDIFKRLDCIQEQLSGLQKCINQKISEVREISFSEETSFLDIFFLKGRIKKDSTGIVLDEEFLHIFLQLDQRDILQIPLVCKRFNNLSKSTLFWRPLLRKHQPQIFEGLHPSIPAKDLAIIGRCAFILDVIRRESVKIKKEQKKIGDIDNLILLSLAPIYVPALLRSASYGLNKIAEIREANILSGALEYMKTHPEVSLEEAKIIVEKALLDSLDSVGYSY